MELCSVRRGGLALALLVALGACGRDESPAADGSGAPRDAGEYAQEADGYGEGGAAGREAGGIDEAEADRLRELGYVDVVETDATELPVGVLESDPARSQPGLTYFTNAMGCSSQLVDAEGRVVRAWSLEPCTQWGNSTLAADGSVLAIHRLPGREQDAGSPSGASELVKLDWEGRVLWRRPMPAHHDVEVLPDGRIATLLASVRRIPEVDPAVPVRDHAIALLSPEGELLEEQSIGDLVLGTPGYPIRMRRPREQDGRMQIDLLHANSVEWMRQESLAARHPLYAPSNVLVCLRHQDAVIVVDWAAKRLLWWWGQGVLSGPHDATVLPDGHILVFDNGLNRRWSRVLEVDPLEERVVWEYRAPEPSDFFTVHRGAAQRLANGNTLVTDSNAGTLFEVTPAGEPVWRFRNPNRSSEGQPIVIVRARRVALLDPAIPVFERSD